MRTILPHELQARFPKLHPGNYERKSRATPRYNCIAFAVGDERHWWERGQYGGRYFWPPNIRDRDPLEEWTKLFLARDYEVIANTAIEVEVGFEKVAIYVSLDHMFPTHVAFSDGHTWKSKLGKGQDIDHLSLAVLEGEEADEYGIVERVLRRPLIARPG